MSSDFPACPMTELIAYQGDLWRRGVNYLDTLRERADNMLEHERAGKPPLLDFDYELILDGRRLARPANYALLRITRVGEECLEDCLDETKPPVMVVDPRAGHGPGIGGFKRDSEVGMALHEGHPVYFVIFFPEPIPGQTLEDVLRIASGAARPFGLEVAQMQSNSEGALVDMIQTARHEAAAIVINPGAYSHTSIAILDALNAFEGPVGEVHISDIHAREAFRHHSYVSLRADVIVVGKGVAGYAEAVEGVGKLLAED